MSTLDGGLKGSSSVCVVSCHKDAWKVVVPSARAKGDALAAMFEPALYCWKMMFGANVERSVHGEHYAAPCEERPALRREQDLTNSNVDSLSYGFET